MIILGISWTICSTAALFVNNRLVACASEERFSRVKNDDAFPSQAITYCLREGAISAGELDAVVVCNYQAPYEGLILGQAAWSIEDYLDEQHRVWYPRFYENESVSRIEAMKNKLKLDAYPADYWKQSREDPEAPRKFNEDRKDIIAAFLGIDRDRVHLTEHHKSHAYYSYFASPFIGEKALSFTVDGIGDGFNATAGIFHGDGRYERIYATNECNIGRIYRYMTLLLGMKPNEHEYKVMGLAPYGKEKYARKALDLFGGTLFVDGTEFRWKNRPRDSYFWFKERLEGIRFDSIAYALQSWVEDLLTKWISNTIRAYGIHKVVISGGVSMNIKAVGNIARLKDVEDLFVAGCGSDESLAIGSIFLHLFESTGYTMDGGFTPVSDLYLGPAVSRDDVARLLSSIDMTKYEVIEDPSAGHIVDRLIGGKVIARCLDRMEFGQRALCNRSILADPINLRTKETINAMVKNRDFWMPFAPVLLDSCTGKYLRNPNGVLSPHMTVGYETTPAGYEAMLAACHPADRSARPQILERRTNPKMYDLLLEFEARTGRGALLNTSFNLHGHPIVNTAGDAFDVFTNSGLDGLYFENALIMKKDSGA
ncbi:MAG: Decarbamoylnovobiocin carbamoyltransferase [Syntrophorhabdus sp. PtaB.Bin047]|nr:MAG: Decarbamoylnovobiocin carbamoyltransferase [Syntrophorhabdus sp. PtaB.Bin047]